MNLFWINLLLHGGYSILLEDISSGSFVVQGAEYMERRSGSAQIFFPHWHLHMKLILRGIVFVLFLASLSVSHPIFFSIFAAHSLSPEVENLK